MAITTLRKAELQRHARAAEIVRAAGRGEAVSAYGLGFARAIVWQAAQPVSGEAEWAAVRDGITGPAARIHADIKRSYWRPALSA